MTVGAGLPRPEMPPNTAGAEFRIPASHAGTFRLKEEIKVMLVLSRKINEAVLIGDSIRVQVLDIKGDQVKLGVSAPSEIKVLRQEILEEIRESTMDASRVEKSEVKRIIKILKGYPKQGYGQNEDM